MTQRVLAVFANPKGSDPLRLSEEDRVLRECLRLARHRQIQLETRHAATIHDLRRALLDENATVVHFSGHGTGRGLAFEDDKEDVRLVPPAALSELLSAYVPTLHTVVLNACYSAIHAESLRNIPFAVLMRQAIADRAAIEFTRGFYDALAAGKDTPFAFFEGLRTLRLLDIQGSEIPVLLQQGRAVTALTQVEYVGNAATEEVEHHAHVDATDREDTAGSDFTHSTHYDVTNEPLTRVREKRRPLAVDIASGFAAMVLAAGGLVWSYTCIVNRVAPRTLQTVTSHTATSPALTMTSETKDSTSEKVRDPVSSSVHALGNLWRPGETLTVRFLDGDPALIKRVKPPILEWAKYGNISFKFVDDSYADVRVSFKTQRTVASLGTTAREISNNMPTVRLPLTTDSSDYVVAAETLHAFGHVLGLINEHLNPNSGLEWNRELMAREMGSVHAVGSWLGDGHYTRDDLPGYRAFDPLSVMMHQFPSRWTYQKMAGQRRATLSSSDKAFIATLYPR